MAAVLALTDAARGDVITYSSSYSVTSGGSFTVLSPPDGRYSGSPPYLFAVGEGIHATLSFPLFNPALGTLAGVRFTLGATQEAGTGELFVVFGAPTNSQVFLLNEVRAVGPTGRLVSTGGSGFTSAPGPGSYSFPLLFATPDATAAYTDPATLATYTGAGAFSIDVFKYLQTGGNPGTFIHTRLTRPGSVAGTLAVTYEFTPESAPVPAPPGYAVLGGAALCILLLRRPRG